MHPVVPVRTPELPDTPRHGTIDPPAGGGVERRGLGWHGLPFVTGIAASDHRVHRPDLGSPGEVCCPISMCNGGGQMPARKTSSERTAQQLLIQELQRLHAEAGLSYRELAAETNYDASYLNRVVNGKSNASPEVMGSLDRIYGTGSLLVGLWELTKSAGVLGYFQKFAAIAAQAASRADYHASLVPGIYQTAGYARELLSTRPWRTAEEVETFVEDRLRRQEPLSDDAPILARVVLDEAVLLRALGDKGAWAEQVNHLIECAQRPNITLQVLPLGSGSHYHVGGGVSLVWLPKGKCVGYVEGNSSGQMVDDPSEVELMRLGYDQIRDRSLSPDESLRMLRKLQVDGGLCGES
ncbi:helix-turn-helix domain-containing protein [Streptomyces rutgersensis]|uniref:Helix-turn-helix domain-containing protein n=2 Tax=Streptomyces TaxID=1883 RepID=A0ABX6RSC2_9ACTN|nr:helix-turn-helix domain-containing protein [Streptomyces rutgersensis]